MTVERYAGEPVAAIVDRFMAMEPKPNGVPTADWLAEQKEIRSRIIELLVEPGSDPRDYRIEPGLWRSQILPMGITIDQAVKDGIW